MIKEERYYDSGWPYIVHYIYPEELVDKAMFCTVEVFRFSLCYEKKAFVLAEISYKMLKSLLCLALCMLQ
ncbi:hypothetical protein SAMN05421542_0715 [Chryseobacterium jejuense]|uniref:Uncharacterized protein n=1 Tax=Chryseobacterium jejuense TaxID=445960 RepID=A0A2X2X1Z3_CHRJE|nr:hypothetical protein SAMN05421542_0715 [Chryseobacterium jejuense]SQB44601.1 Uncharacterised protein [Chryseobacterium jejuense]